MISHFKKGFFVYLDPCMEKLKYRNIVRPIGHIYFQLMLYLKMVKIIEGILERHALTVANGITGKSKGIFTRARTTAVGEELI